MKHGDGDAIEILRWVIKFFKFSWDSVIAVGIITTKMLHLT